MKLRKKRSSEQTIQDAVRGSVPNGRLQGTRICLTDDRSNAIGGVTVYAKTGDAIERLQVPRGIDSYSSTVRSHEGRHASFSKRWSPQVKKATKVSEKLCYAVNIIEDCYVEQKPLPHLDFSALKEYSRTHLATALSDIRQILKHKRFCDKNPHDDRNNPRGRNGRLMTAARVIAMLKTYGPYGESRHEEFAEAKLVEAIGSPSVEVLKRVASIAKKGERKLAAMRLLAALLEDEETDMPDDELLKLPPVEGTGKGVGMVIRDLLPKSEWTSHEKKVSIVPAPTGSIVRVQRYIAAIVSGDSSGLFARRMRQNPSGTVLIDASGSMHATTENVKCLCKMIPDATVAYYSGDDVKSGVLAIYAEKNKRYGGELPSDTLRGGNSVDMEALQWLQKQPLPWTFITDLGFCGSSFGGEEVAHAIVDRETALGKLTIIPTFKKAFEVFAARGSTRKVALPTAAGIRAGEHLAADPDAEDVL